MWTAEQQHAANQENWELVDTFDLESRRLVLRIYGRSGATNQQAQQHVVAAARNGSGLHIEALRAISQSSLKKGKK